MSSRRTLVAGVLLLAATGGCTADPHPESEAKATWQTVERDGLAPNQKMAVFLSTFPDADNRAGYVGLVDTSGKTTFLTTQFHDNGLVAARDGVLCATDRLATYQISDKGASKVERGGYEMSSGHWTGVKGDGTCVTVLNSGMGTRHYDTEVYWQDRGELRKSVVPDVPGPTGQSPGAIWVRNAGVSEIPGRLKLYRTDLETGATVEVMSWPTRTTERAGLKVHFDDGYATNLFWDNERLVYLEDLTTVDERGERVDIKPGFSSELRLASIDPVGKVHSSTLLRYTAGGLRGPAESPGSTNVAAIAMRAGHLHAGSIFSATSAGEVIAVDIAKKSIRTVGSLTRDARTAVEAVAAWRKDRLYLVLLSEEKEVTLESYDLERGKLLESQRLSGWQKLVDGGQLYLSSAAATQ
jgi:hypothetical protein